MASSLSSSLKGGHGDDRGDASSSSDDESELGASVRSSLKHSLSSDPEFLALGTDMGRGGLYVPVRLVYIKLTSKFLEGRR